MQKETANFERMNKTTVHELEVLNATCGYVAIISNGNLLGIVEESHAEAFEAERVKNGL